MTHLSSFRYGEKLKEKPTVSRGYGKVRISYFDPVTGKPCNEKPEPLHVQRERRQTAAERFEQHQRGVAEAAEIAANMKRRNAKERRAKGCKGYPGRAVLVDGELFKSVTAAAEEIGVHNSYLSKQLLAGAKQCHGRMIEFAEVSK